MHSFMFNEGKIHSEILFNELLENNPGLNGRWPAHTHAVHTHGSTDGILTGSQSFPTES